MILIEVPANAVRTVRGRKDPTKSYTFCTAYAYTADRDGNQQPHPSRFEFAVRDGQQPPAAGRYSLAPASIYVDGDGRLAIAPKLVPAK